MAIVRHLIDLFRLNWHFTHWSQRRIRNWQKKKVLQFLAAARKESDYYREIFRGYAVTSLEAYAVLPTLNKELMMRHFDQINTVGLKLDQVMDYAVEKELKKDYLGYYQDRFVIGLSSGTSGNKGIYITPRELTRRLPGVFLARGGVRLRDLPLRILFILRVFSQGFADINAPLIQLRYLPSMTDPLQIIEMLNRMSANILMAPPSLLRQLLPLAGLVKKPPRRIITYAEVLEPEEKLRFSRTFRAPVVEIYQASEGQIASPCRLGSLHINEDLVYVELLGADGKTAVSQPGERSKRMLVTNLVNRAQPLLRYEMNDMIELGQPCSCGSNFRTIARVIGRNDDVLYLRNSKGSRVAVFPDLVSRWIITCDDRIREFIIEQQSDHHLNITLDIMGADNQPSVADRIKELLIQRLNDELSFFDISCRLNIIIAAIQPPSGNLKQKRIRAQQGLELD